jgi:hypothetical protein
MTFYVRSARQVSLGSQNISRFFSLPSCAAVRSAFVWAHRQLRGIELQLLIARLMPRQLVAPPLQAFGPNHLSVAVPPQDLDPIPLAVEEQEQVTIKQVPRKDRLHGGAEAVEALAAIDSLQRHEHLNARRQAQHTRASTWTPATASITARIASRSPLGTNTRVPLVSTTSTVPDAPVICTGRKLSAVADLSSAPRDGGFVSTFCRHT